MDHQKNAAAILSDLVGTIKNFSDSVLTYFNQIGEQEVLNPIQHIESTNINEPMPCEFFEIFGVRRLILNPVPGRLATYDLFQMERDNKKIIPGQWSNIKTDEIIEKLKMVFGRCVVIEFEDWTRVNNGTDFWDGLLSDVIRPLNKKDFQFIFYLGDPTNKLVFETDEILDLISEYSSYGKVTLVLERNQADRLWNILNGWNPASTHVQDKSSGEMEKYMSIFNTINIDLLVIFAANCTILLSREQQFEFACRSSNSINSSKYGRDCFDAGYQLGLLLQLKLPHCVALGLAVSGAHLENESEPEQRTLLKYIEGWIGELKSTETMVQSALPQKI